ncbi:hypothetical protein LX36DRAFT_496286 [Colletotrichum falcatum]|nr:hypothetical protein LX36DRAFT_496286 [Colletotrichum falcatum]
MRSSTTLPRSVDVSIAMDAMALWRERRTGSGCCVMVGCCVTVGSCVMVSGSNAVACQGTMRSRLREVVRGEREREREPSSNIPRREG